MPPFPPQPCPALLCLQTMGSVVLEDCRDEGWDGGSSEWILEESVPNTSCLILSKKGGAQLSWSRQEPTRVFLEVTSPPLLAPGGDSGVAGKCQTLSCSSQAKEM